MAWVAVIFLSIAFACAVNGQIIRFDTGNAILQRSAAGVISTIITETPAGASSRKICYDGSNVLRTSGSQVLLGGTVVIATPNGEDILGLACCCNLVAITYVDGGQMRIRFEKRGRPELYVDVALLATQENPNANCPVLHCDATSRKLFVLSLTCLWCFDIDDLAAAPWKTTLPASALFAKPTCVAVREVGGDYDIYVSSVGNNYVDVFRLDVANHGLTALNQYRTFFAHNPIDVTCVYYDENGLVYLLTSSTTAHYILSVSTANIADSALSPDTNPTPVSYTPSIQSGISGANGINVCGATCMAVECLDDGNCACSAATCGFCLFDSIICQCANSADVDPCFFSSTVPVVCRQVLPETPACCFTRNINQMRRSGDICVVGWTRVAATVSFGRKAPTGRWEIKFPMANPYPAAPANGGPSHNGFRFLGTMPTRRGQKFGLFGVTVTPSLSTAIEEIPCFSTENSGFTNLHYTLTVVTGNNANLRANGAIFSQVRLFQTTLRWWYTAFDAQWQPSSEVAVNPECNGMLECEVCDSCTAANEGLYQVARGARRKMRTWHPFFLLYVRECAATQYMDSSGSCMNGPSCTVNQGVVDDEANRCICFPGYFGPLCQWDCPDDHFVTDLSVVTNLPADACEYSCADVFGSGTCEGVLVCYSRKRGCRCLRRYSLPFCSL